MEFNYQQYHEKKDQDKNKFKHVTLEPELVIDIHLMKAMGSKTGKAIFVKRYTDQSYERKRPFSVFQSDHLMQISPPPAPLEPIQLSEDNPLLYDFD